MKTDNHRDGQSMNDSQVSSVMKIEVMGNCLGRSKLLTSKNYDLKRFE